MPLEDLTPSNRFELALSGDMTAEEASNRIEKILAGADIEPADRLEYFLKLRVSQGGGGGAVTCETGTFAYPERTQEHTITPVNSWDNIIIFAESYNYSLGTAGMMVVEYPTYQAYGAGTNNTGTAIVSLDPQQGAITKNSDGSFTYRAAGSGDTSRMIQAGINYRWVCW